LDIRAIPHGNHVFVTGTTATDERSEIVGVGDAYARTVQVIRYKSVLRPLFLPLPINAERRREVARTPQKSSVWPESEVEWGHCERFATKDVTQLLIDWNNGNRQALDELLPLVYDELRRVAARYLQRERPGHTLQGTALVHEAYLRLIDQTRVRWQNRAHFLGVAAQMIRRILVDHARAKQSAKRGGIAMKLSLDESIEAPERREVDLGALDDALEDLGKIDPQQTRVVELRFFTGLSIEETAEALSISPATVKRDWVVARAWLFRELSGYADTAP
jgi:RNA polymerase sigma factor (TIGR02999 family)